MDPNAFLQTIYLGDRGCKAILIDSWNRRIAIQVTMISRLKPGTKTWDYYTQADIENGWMVFSEVRSIRFEPTGHLPNEYINDFSVQPMDSKDHARLYLFELSIGSVDESGDRTEVLIQIEATRFHLENPKKPGVEINV